jgi:hypothetical protein
MADPLEAAGSIVGIVAFGMQLATTLQTYIELTADTKEHLHDLVFDVNATASALRQLQDIIDSDKASTQDNNLSPIFKDAGLKEIEGLAIKCERVYKTIIILVQKASNSEHKAGVSGETKDTNRHEMAINPSSLKSSSLIRRLRWPWLAPRVNHCQEQLRWLKMSLLLNLQLANLARLQWSMKSGHGLTPSLNTLADKYHSTNEPRHGAFDQEIAIRAAAEALRERQKLLVQKITRKQDKTRKDKARQDSARQRYSNSSSDSSSGSSSHPWEGEAPPGGSAGKSTTTVLSPPLGGTPTRESNAFAKISTHPLAPQTPGPASSPRVEPSDQNVQKPGQEPDPYNPISDATTVFKRPGTRLGAESHKHN